MSPLYTAPAPLWGTSSVASWLRAAHPVKVTLLVDPAVDGQPFVRELRDAAGAVATTVSRSAPGRCDLGAIGNLAADLGPEGLVLAVGGGGVMDLAKLAALVACRPEAWLRIGAPQRSGMVALPPELGAEVAVVAVPTTLGTGSERGTVACLEYEGGKRLVTGPCLRPVAAVWDARATATLPSQLVAEGVLEALFRTVSTYVGDPADHSVVDELLLELAARLVRAGDEVAGCHRRGDAADAGLRLLVAELSAESQVGAINLGRSPYAVKGWPIANELSTALGVPKMRAVAAIWPALWRRVAAGDTRLGDARHLDLLWTRLRSVSAHLPARPDHGIAALADRWGVQRDLPATDAQLDGVVTRTMRAWGAGLPMLGGLTAADLRALLVEATAPGTPHTDHRAAGLCPSA